MTSVGGMSWISRGIARSREVITDGFVEGLVSQGFSSLSNFLLVVAVARAENPRAFGSFAIAYSIYLVALGISRGLTGETLSVTSPRGTDPGDSRDDGPTAALATALAVGILLGVPMLVAGLLAGHELRAPFMAFAIGFPLLLLQDAARYVAFSRLQPRLAARSDLIWVSVQVAGTVALFLAGAASAVALVGLWWMASTLGYVAVIKSVGLPRLAAAPTWLRRNKRLGLGFAAEFILQPGANHVALFMVGFVAGLPAAGALRAAQTLYGPLNSLLLGIYSIAVPEAARRSAQEDRGSLRRYIRGWTAIFAVLGGVAALIVVLLPDGLGSALLDDTWPLAAPVLVPLGFRFVATAVARGYQIGLHASHSVRQSVIVRGTTGILGIGLGSLGAFLHGALGAATGLAVAFTVGAVLSGLTFRSVAGGRAVQ